MKLKITTDNEWQGKYDILDREYLEDKLDICSLGDNLPTGTKEQVGGKSYFKVTLEELAGKGQVLNNSLHDQLRLVYGHDPKKFIANYGNVPDFIREGVLSLQSSGIPLINAIMGNREYDYQIVLDFLNEIGHSDTISYLKSLYSCPKISLRKEPGVDMIDSTGIIFLPYNPDPKEYNGSYFDYFNDNKPDRIVIFTHENPCPEVFGSKRKVTMRETLDQHIEMSRKINQDTTLFCGHLDISSGPLIYKGIKVQPISGSEALVIDMESGEYAKHEIK